MWSYAKALDEVMRLKAWIKILIETSSNAERLKSPASHRATPAKGKTAAAELMRALRAKRKAERGVTEHRDPFTVREHEWRPFETARASFESYREVGATGCAWGARAKAYARHQRGDEIAHDCALTVHLTGTE